MPAIKHSKETAKPTTVPIEPDPEDFATRPGIPSTVGYSDYGDQLVDNFQWIRFILLVFGRWPLMYDKKSPKKFFWKLSSLRSIYFFVVSFLAIVTFIVSNYNIVAIMIIQRYKPKGRSEQEVLEQALVERNTVSLMVILLCLFCHCVTSVLLILRRRLLEGFFNELVLFSVRAKINLTKSTYAEIIPLFGLILGSYAALVYLAFFKPTATTDGTPTVMSIVMFRPFLPRDYLTTATYPGSRTHLIMRTIGIISVLFFTFTAYVFIFLFFWIIRALRNGWSTWNLRAFACCCRGEKLATEKDRTTYTCMFKDHADLQRLTKNFNDVIDLILESYFLKFTFIICYGTHLVVKSALKSNEEGISFIRPFDYIPAAVIAILNLALISMVMLSACWFEDDAMNGYEVIRRKAYMDGMQTDVQVYFCMTLLQAYTGPTKLKVEAGGYINIDRSNILVLFSLLFTSTLVIYQLNPAYDSNTIYSLKYRKIIKRFLAVFEK